MQKKKKKKKKKVGEKERKRKSRKKKGKKKEKEKKKEKGKKEKKKKRGKKKENKKIEEKKKKKKKERERKRHFCLAQSLCELTLCTTGSAAQISLVVKRITAVKHSKMERSFFFSTKPKRKISCCETKDTHKYNIPHWV